MLVQIFPMNSNIKPIIFLNLNPNLNSIIYPKPSPLPTFSSKHPLKHKNLPKESKCANSYMLTPSFLNHSMASSNTNPRPPAAPRIPEAPTPLAGNDRGRQQGPPELTVATKTAGGDAGGLPSPSPKGAAAAGGGGR